MSATNARVQQHFVCPYKTTGSSDEVDLPIINAPELPEFSLQPQDKQKGKYYYGVRIVTGHQAGSNATSIDVFFTLAGCKSETKKISLSLFQWLQATDSFHKDTHDDMIIETDDHLGDVQIVGVGLRDDLIAKLKAYVLNCHWYVNYISIIDFQDNEVESHFPCYHWLGYDNKELTASAKTCIQKDIMHEPALLEQRSQQIANRMEQYQWKEYPNLPSHFDDTMPFPIDEEFHRVKEVNFLINAFRGIYFNGEAIAAAVSAVDNVIQKALGIGTSTLTTPNSLYIFEQLPQRLLIKQIENRKKDPAEVTKEDGPELMICQAHRWITDEEFGRQILNGVNPVVIRRCSVLPDNFPVTNDMVKDLLVRNMSLQEEMKSGHVYICDLSEIMDGVPCRDGCYCAAPICLLYVNKLMKLVPIAIQLKKTPGPDNPIFLPSDRWFDWVLAKIYFRSADAQFHQVSTHYIACHATMEAYGVATMRNIPDAHPLFRLLVPHFRYTIGINHAARKVLINKGGIIDKAFSVGGKGKELLFKRAGKIFDVRGADVKENVKKRGVDDPNLLPNYYYRDDGILIWDAIESYVRDIIAIFYKSDDDVKEDIEVQNWANDTHLLAFPGDNGAPVGHGFPDKMESREDLIYYCTLIMFTGSAQHAAVNFGQFSVAGFVPNSPYALRKEPPSEKGKTTFEDILESLPSVFTAGLSIGIVYSLAQYSNDEMFMKAYPNCWTSKECRAATNLFREKMEDLDEKLKKRNDGIEIPYSYLMPSRIPTSITI